jgi:hypothetical protein
MALQLLPRLTWKEALTGIKPGWHGHLGYRIDTEEPSQAWDVLQVALFWRISEIV